MMRLLDRFKMFREGGVIDRSTYESLQLILTRLEDKWQLPITDENGAGLMTYTALMIMRLKRGEVSAPMDRIVLEDLKKDDRLFKKAADIVADIEVNIGMTIPESEREYIIANLNTILNPQIY